MRNQNVPFNKNLLVAHLLLHLLLNDCHNWFYVRCKKSGPARNISVRGVCRGQWLRSPASTRWGGESQFPPHAACLTSANLYCMSQMGLPIWVVQPCDFNTKHASALINPDSQKESHFAILGLFMSHQSLPVWNNVGKWISILKVAIMEEKFRLCCCQRMQAEPTVNREDIAMRPQGTDSTVIHMGPGIT